MRNFMLVVMTLAGLVVGNFFYQKFLSAITDYSIAIERSMFQAIACLSLWINYCVFVPEKTKEPNNDKSNNNIPANNQT